MLICCSINWAQIVLSINKRIPRIQPISVITCSCSLCEESKNKGKTAFYSSFISKLYIRAAGYSRIKNRVYFDVFLDKSSYVIHTVECTPRDNQRGIVKHVIKGQWSNTLWTAVQLPGDIFAFYSIQNNLIGYQWKNLIFNSWHKEVLYIIKQNYAYKTGFQQKSPQKFKFAIFDQKNLLVAIITKEAGSTSVYRPKERTEMAERSMLELVF